MDLAKWGISYQKEANNTYFIYPSDEAEFEKLVFINNDNKGLMIRIFTNNEFVYERIVDSKKVEWGNNTNPFAFVRGTSIKRKDIERIYIKYPQSTTKIDNTKIHQVFKNCEIYAVPKGYEDMLPPKETNTYNKPIQKEDSDQNKGDTMNDKTKIPPLNQILYGPPGTGKTYNTINKALEILGEKIDGKSRAEIKTKFDEYRQNGQIEFATFHQSFSYEEFVEGIKPKLIDSSNGAESSEMSYTIKNGIFKEICKKALEELCRFKEEYANLVKKFYGDILKKLKQEQEFSHKGITFELTQQGNEIQTKGSKGQAVWKDEITKLLMLQNSKNLSDDDIKNSIDIDEGFVPLYKAMRDYFFSEYLKGKPKPYILIIDEINRGNISKILGELITLIEPSKRIGADEELRVTLPYSNDEFGVPSNLYIIGTMNTADRSIALLDAALRRRFEFVEMMPNPKLLKDNKVGNTEINLQTLLEKMNERIEFLLDREHTIGHSFFIGVDSLDKLREVFKLKIIPLLQEYFYDDYAKIDAVLGGNGMVEKAYKSVVSLFQNPKSRSDDLEDKTIYNIAPLDSGIWDNPQTYKSIYGGCWVEDSRDFDESDKNE